MALAALIGDPHYTVTAPATNRRRARRTWIWAALVYVQSRRVLA
jgi:hypothetical protein